MTFIVTLIGLLIERFFDWSHLRHWHWFSVYQAAIANRIPAKSSYLQDWLYGFVKLIFNVVILIYCLGPKDLWADAFACTTALSQADKEQAAEKLKASFGIEEKGSYTQSLHRHLLNNLFIEANRRVFAVVFWFVALGPVGAVFYRMVTLETAPALTHSARSVEAVLNWIPIRILTFLFALGGHFAKVLSYWRKNVLRGLDSNEALLTECGIAALGNEDQGDIPEDGSLERSAIHLLDRAFVIMLVIVAVIVLLS
jgi:AmpE protein